ncbi:MAG: nucleotidyltransferase domain-containing protein [Blautia sp.]|nr:nucleotidyltransferase domain-containing protein [Lachnoclostridium sp.]MCM1211338.1 nucleotidyltransferase domain-containing protein [Blautia sp.]
MCTKSELQQVLKEVRNAAKQLYGDKLDKIILYGSYARGDNTEESDIDIMIVLDGDAADIKKLRGLTAEMASDISLEQEVFLSILLRDRKHFEENLDFLPFYQNIVREGITVYG